MPTKQRRNAELVANLKPDFTTRSEFYHSPARLNDALYWPTRFAGGQRAWAWDATAPSILTSIGTLAPNAAPSVAAVDFFATDHGAPYINLDGASEYLEWDDTAWQEPGADNFFVWSWVNTTSVAGIYMIVGKYLIAGDQRSWKLDYYNVGNAFRFILSSLGTAVSTISVPSTYGVPTLNKWYFVAGFYQASTRSSVFVGAADDDTLTVDTVGGATPATLKDGTATFVIGADSAPGSYWPGLISVCGGWFNTASADIDSHALTLFHNTRWFYQ